MFGEIIAEYNKIQICTFPFVSDFFHTVIIRDLQGKTLREQPMQNKGNEQTARLELQALPNGMYMLEIRSEGKLVTKAKIIKQ